MNQRDMVRELRERVPEINTQTCNKVINAIFRQIIPGALERGEDVSLTEWGTYTIKRRAPRKGRNPQTQSPMVIPETVVPCFIPGDSLKTRVRNSPAARMLLGEQR